MRLKLFGDGDAGKWGDAQKTGKCMATNARGGQCKRYARVMMPASQVGLAVPGIPEVGLCAMHAAAGQGDEPGEIGGR